MAARRRRPRTPPPRTSHAALRLHQRQFPDQSSSLGRREQRSRLLRVCFLLEALSARRRQSRTLPQPPHRRASGADSRGSRPPKEKSSLQRSAKNLGRRSPVPAAVVRRRHFRPPPLPRRPDALAHRRLRFPRASAALVRAGFHSFTKTNRPLTPLLP